MQEKIRQKVQTLEEETFVRMQADEARHGRVREALERLSGKIRDLTGRISAEDYVSLRRVTKLEVSCEEIHEITSIFTPLVRGRRGEM